MEKQNLIELINEIFEPDEYDKADDVFIFRQRIGAFRFSDFTNAIRTQVLREAANAMRCMGKEVAPSPMVNALAAARMLEQMASEIAK